jgi:hypothetical protein
MTRLAASRSLIRACTLMDSEPLMTPESAHARKTLRNGSMPAAIMVVDEIPVTAVGTVKAVALLVPELSGRSIEAMVLAGRISAAPGIRVSIADLFKAPTAGNTDLQLDQMADARK